MLFSFWVFILKEKEKEWGTLRKKERKEKTNRYDSPWWWKKSRKKARTSFIWNSIVPEIVLSFKYVQIKSYFMNRVLLRRFCLWLKEGGGKNVWPAITEGSISTSICTWLVSCRFGLCYFKNSSFFLIPWILDYLADFFSIFTTPNLGLHLKKKRQRHWVDRRQLWSSAIVLTK